MSCWLAPESDDETIEVPRDTGLINHEKEDGILANDNRLNMQLDQVGSCVWLTTVHFLTRQGD